MKLSWLLIQDLVGKKILAIEGDCETELTIVTEKYKFTFSHRQECCEVVHIEDICGDWNDLIGEVCTMAECETNDGDVPNDYSCLLWTFYKFGSVKGIVTVRWLGESNGYYSVTVDMRITRNLRGCDGKE